MPRDVQPAPTPPMCFRKAFLMIPMTAFMCVYQSFISLFSPPRSQSSTTHGAHTYSSGRRTVSPFSWSPHALLGRLSSQFHSSKHGGEATELHHRQKRTIFSRRSPPVVEVATVQDKKVWLSETVFNPQSPMISMQALFVARRPEQDKAQQQKPHRPAQASTSQTQPTTSSTSTAHPATDSNTTTPGAPTVKSRILSVLPHLVLFVCCASTQHTNGHK